jgi:hypothetical protein
MTKMQAAQMLLDGSEEAPAQASGGFREFMSVSAQESGLFLPAQAALVLGLSNQRVLQLMEVGKFRSWEFFGKSYVSCREVEARKAAGINKGGRPRRTLGERVKVAGKLLASMDGPQWAAAVVE